VPRPRRPDDAQRPELPEQRGALCIGHAPADHATTEDVEDDVDIEVAPLGWSHQLGDIPGPDLIGPFGKEFGLPVDGMAELLAAFANFAVLVQDAVYGTDRAVVDAFIERTGVDFGRRLVCERGACNKYSTAWQLRTAQCPDRPWSLSGDSRRCGQAGAAPAVRWHVRP